MAGDLRRVDFRNGGLATLVIAAVGLAASAFVPQTYYKFGCPTGLVLVYLRARRHEVGLARRVWLGGGANGAGGSVG